MSAIHCFFVCLFVTGDQTHDRAFARQVFMPLSSGPNHTYLYSQCEETFIELKSNNLKLTYFRKKF